MPSSTAHIVSLPVPTDDLRIEKLQTLSPPARVIGEAPATSSVAEVVGAGRRAVHEILQGRDDRLAVVIGPCSIHDPKAALEYAHRLAAERERHAGELEIIMRVYFEKPRTTVGWKGLINDPDLDGGFRINEGLRLARRVLLDVSAQGLPAACEFLDVTTPQYIADLVAWGAIGARTTESQIHREMASGLSCPVGFKNGTNGDVKVAVDAVMAASQPHHFLAVTKEGRAAIATTTGNADCHLVLRGGKTPNYDAASVAAAAEVLKKAGLPERIMVDVSHANSGKNHENQPAVVADVCAQVATGASPIMGVMIESHLVAGRQEIVPGKPLTYGQSVTDACVDWETSVRMLDDLAAAVRAGRAARR
ncbi:3-deoxy-7-phosphoheptulonate synthase [Caulobacter segnis]|uniref:Phospho-2-dehydro-3-deoxyheptonate aldolase n=2 Tax=Caulobacter segnis TaxID=88688 RepID=D5VHU8_CAUST|nr:3-deoxy-7-phosphoheptulonate synthase [Caulobacter segnis]ADG09079.1 phospho-2-dehydro-3-deoxyheptonate aldolase [Caulobacter segnis ATCC 21756]AVQ00902.1 3-deoxy-7-phosphoheptulonate synthase [Caulobacter segnis]